VTDNVSFTRSFWAPRGKREAMWRYFHNMGKAYGLTVHIAKRYKNDKDRMTVTFSGVPNGDWGGVDRMNSRLDSIDWSLL